MTDLPRLTDTEIAALSARATERAASLPQVSVEMKDQIAQLKIGAGTFEDEHARLMSALGIADPSFLSAFLSQLCSALSEKAGITSTNLQYALNTVASIKPADEIEAMLAAQMASVHACSMNASARYMNATTLQGKDSAERALNKLARTFAAQVEALRKHRNGGKQTVIVQHVNVADGGQAIVGHVQTGGRGTDE